MTGDGAYDSKMNYATVRGWGATPVFPPPVNATVNTKSDPLRRYYVERIDALGGDADARKQWKTEVGYHKHSLVETAMFRFKTIFGDKLRSRKFENQAAEAILKAHLINKMTAMGMPQSYAV